MNILSFLDLIREIFYAKDPNIERIQKKGLLAVKIAQTFALRIDFLDEERCLKLSRLFNHVERIPVEDVDSLILKYVEKEWFSHFTTFDRACFASASIGQVHRAQLKSGEEVAVKIIKKDFKTQFTKDAKALLRLFQFILKIYPTLAKVADPIGIIEHIRQFTLDELDLRNEMAHREVLYDIYARNKDRVDLSKLKFIEIYKDLSSENIMVSKFIEGETFDKKLSEGTLSYEHLLELFHIHGFYMFGIGTFHGDIHPGNIILNGGDIYFVDCGAIGHVKAQMRQGLFQFMEALSFYEYEECAAALHRMSDVKLEGKTYEKFREKFLDLYKDFSEKNVSEISLTQKMMETIKLGVRSGMSFEQGMFPIIKSLMYLDGMVLKCNPKAVLMKDMRTFIPELKKYVK